MIIAGDYIEGSIGVYFCLSTMAAAALGNTVSDVFGLWLATYVEQFCRFMGIRPPELTPTQYSMPVTQRIASLVIQTLLAYCGKEFEFLISFFYSNKIPGPCNWNHGRLYSWNDSASVQGRQKRRRRRREACSNRKEWIKCIIKSAISLPNHIP